MNIDLVKHFKDVVLNAESLKEDDIVRLLKEHLNEFKLDITKTIFDSKKFSEISNDIFIDKIYPLLKINKFNNETQDISVKQILKEFPETRGILKHVYLKITEDGDFDSDLGCIFAETEELDRFRVTIFLGTLFSTISVLHKNYFLKKKINSFNKVEKEDFFKFLIGILVHELTHLIDYFRYTREELIKDFQKFYLLQDGERKAFVQEFLYHFVSENGVQVIKQTNDFDIFKEFLIKKMSCWQLLKRLDIEPNQPFIDDFLHALYSYFKSGKNEFGKVKTERVSETSPFVCVTRLKDVIDFVPDESTKQLINKLTNSG